MTWRDDVVDVDAPVRAGWEILDGLRSIAFTGAVRFPLMPVATVYFDRGRIYYAERAGDPDVADRLVAAGGVRPRDLATGVVVVGGEDEAGDVDHLGRLFDRVPSLDRQRVMLALELITEKTVAWVAGQSVGSATTEPYSYHPSGVHRWYDPVLASPPAFTLPPPRATTDRRHTPVDLPEVRVAWPEPAPSPPSEAPASPTPAPSADAPAEAPAERPADTSTATPAPEPGRPPVSSTSAPADPAYDAPPRRRWDPLDPAPVAELTDGPDETVDDFAVVWPSGELGGDDEPGPVAAAATPIANAFDRFDGPPDPSEHEFDYGTRSETDSDAAEVAIAVRRAIAAVESGTMRGRSRSPVIPVHDEVPDPFVQWTDDEPRHGASRSGDRDVTDDPDRFLDDPFDPDRRTSSPGRQMSVEERRSALQRLIDTMRGR